VIVSILFRGHEPRITTERILSQEQTAEMVIFAEFSVWHFVTKSTSLKSLKPDTLSHFSESRDPIYLGSAMYPERPRKDWRDKSCWQYPRESSREIQGPGGVTTTPTLVGLVVAWTEGNFLRLMLNLRYFRST